MNTSSSDLMVLVRTYVLRLPGCKNAGGGAAQGDIAEWNGLGGAQPPPPVLSTGQQLRARLLLNL